MPENKEQLSEIAQEIKAAARRANNEEEIKVRFIRALEPLLDNMDIEVPAMEKRTSFKGLMDAVYGQCIVEFKAPGKLDIESTGKQLKEYLEAEAEESGDSREEALRRIAGVATDGLQIFFLRYWPSELEVSRPIEQQKTLFDTETEGGFQVIGPMDINAASLDKFLVRIRALKRKTLEPESLVSEFGPGSSMARKTIKNLYSALNQTEDPAVQDFYNQWKKTFGVIYGEDVGKAERDLSEVAEAYSLSSQNLHLQPLLFTLHTYYALLIKLLAGEILSLQRKGFVAPTLLPDLLSSNNLEDLKGQLEHLESGGYFRNYGISNFLEGDFFRWYLREWDEKLYDTVYQIVNSLDNFEPATPQLRPEGSRDLLKNLYQDLVPKELRHDLGEYYTPDWVAKRVLNQLEYDGNPDERALDPACGSGTFLMLAIQRAKDYMDRNLLGRGQTDRREFAQKILNNIVGYDLNPLAIIAARTNYLLAMGDLLNYVLPDVEIPVYMSDSILTPYERSGQQEMFMSENVYALPTVVGEFDIPITSANKGEIGKLASLLEKCSRDGYNLDEFWTRVKNELESAQEDELESEFKELYKKILKLEEEDRDGIWARLIKNAFAPIVQDSFDYLIGNPPWINWQSLSEEWREQSKHLWNYYGLFSLSGHEARLGGGKKDMSMLFVYHCMDSYLKDEGKLGFVITQTLFKTSGAGDGFRQFKYQKSYNPDPDGADLVELKVESVDDLVELKPFEGASNRTSIVVINKGKATEYPVQYKLWLKDKWGRIPEETPLSEVKEEWSKVLPFSAKPVNEHKKNSPWLTSRSSGLDAMRKVIEQSDYEAHAGSTTWLNGVFWVDILEKRPDGKLIIKNLPDMGRKKVKELQKPVEPDLVYPLLRGQEVEKWNSESSNYIILTQNPETRVGWAENKMKEKWPETYSFLKEFEQQLRSRSGYKKYFNSSDPFYSIYNVGSYTMNNFKVVWREQKDFLTASVIEDSELVDQKKKKVIIPDHKLMLIPFEGIEESHYVCALLNSSPARLVVKSYVVENSTSTHVLDHINIPRYEPNNDLHAKLCSLSQKAHKFAQEEQEDNLTKVEQRINETAAGLWNITDEELADIDRSLEELG